MNSSLNEMTTNFKITSDRIGKRAAGATHPRSTQYLLFRPSQRESWPLAAIMAFDPDEAHKILIASMRQRSMEQAWTRTGALFC